MSQTLLEAPKVPSLVTRCRGETLSLETRLPPTYKLLVLIPWFLWGRRWPHTRVIPRARVRGFLSPPLEPGGQGRVLLEAGQCCGHGLHQL